MTATTGPVPHVGRRERGLRDDAFRLTGDSHADLERMANACAPAAPLGPIEEARGRIRVQLGALQTLLGPSVLVLVEAAVDDLHYAAVDYRGRTIMLEGVTRRLGNDVEDARAERDRARDFACALEAENARLADPWIGRYLQALEDAAGEEVRQRIVAEVNASLAPPPAPPEPGIPDPGLPIVDDASLPEHDVQFLSADGTAIAVGHLDIFGPLDQAVQIAVGAVPADLPGDEAAHPLDDLDAEVHDPDRVTWPDGTEWMASADVPGAWLLASTPQNDGEWAHVAAPVGDPAPGSRRVVRGALWGPFGDPPESPRQAPPGPPTPPRPPHHNPVA